jgi:hypothetical protein
MREVSAQIDRSGLRSTWAPDSHTNPEFSHGLVYQRVMRSFAVVREHNAASGTLAPFAAVPRFRQLTEVHRTRSRGAETGKVCDGFRMPAP